MSFLTSRTVLCLLTTLVFSNTLLAAAIDLFTAPTTQLRGANMFQQEKYANPGDVWNPKITQQDLINLRGKGANLVNFSVPGIYDVKTYTRRDDFVAKLDQLVSMATTANLYVVISFRTGPGRGEGNITGDGLNNSELFSSASAQNAFVQMWKDVAFKYKDHPNVIAYDILVEPHDISTATWSALAQKVADGIRTVDAEKPIVISLPDWGNYAQVATWLPLTGSNLVYAIHQYEPYDYTHNDVASNEVVALDGIYNAIANWRNVHHKPIFINEIGLATKVKNGTTFMNTQLQKVEALGLNHAAWIWEVAFDPDYDYAEFDFKKHGGLMSVYQGFWSQNSNFPAGTVPPLPPVLPPVFAYPCGEVDNFNNSIFQTRLYLSRDCVTGELQLMFTGALFRKEYKANVTGQKSSVTVSSTVDTDSDDQVTTVNEKNLNMSLSLGLGEEKGVRLAPVSADGQVCLKLLGPKKLALKAGPQKIGRTIEVGEKFDLATLNDCP